MFVLWTTYLASLAVNISYAQLLRQAPLGNLPTENILTPEIDRFVEEILDDWNSVGGVGVAVVQKKAGGLWNIENKGYGTAKGDGSPVTEDTLFSIASNSKLFDVFAVGLLVSNESLSPRISWDTKIASILPEWGLQDPIASSESTILDLMSHRTGLPNHDLMYEANTTLSDLVARSRYLKPSTSFREKWQYTNIMYAILSYLPQVLIPSLPSYANYVKDNVFVPLGLNQTTFSTEMAEKTGNLALGFARDKVNKIENLFAQGTTRVLPSWTSANEDGDVLAGAGGIHMSVKDVSVWLQTLLLSGKNPADDSIVIPENVVQKAATGISVESGSSAWPELSPAIYGGGQRSYSYQGHNIVEHSGGVPGFQTQIARFPSDDLGVAVFTNDDSFGGMIMQIIKWRIVDQVFRLQPIDWNTRWKSFVSARYNRSTSSLVPRPSEPFRPSVLLSEIAGIYDNPAYGTLELCLVSEFTYTQSDSCRLLVDEVPSRLPDVINTSVPTFVAHWNKFWVSHLKLEHFDSDLFNATALRSLPILNNSMETSSSSSPYWVQIWDEISPTATAEFSIQDGVVDGFGMMGVWGAEHGVKSPGDESVKERAEIWFSRRI